LEVQVQKHKKLAVVIALVLAAYLGTYVWLSRRGYAEADQQSMDGFFYFSPENSAAWRYKNYGCVFLFWPLNEVDRALGLGRYPSSEPLWGLSK
jgi:hypothetical protein